MLVPNPRSLSVKEHSHTLDSSALREALDVAWGIVGVPFRATGASSNFSVTTTTDFTLTNIKVHSSRLYRAHLHGELLVGGLAGIWRFNLMEGGVNVGRLGSAGTLLGSNVPADFSCLWLPPTGTYTMGVQAEEVSGLATVQFIAGSTREFWIEDIGRRR